MATAPIDKLDFLYSSLLGKVLRLQEHAGKPLGQVTDVAETWVTIEMGDQDDDDDDYSDAGQARMIKLRPLDALKQYIASNPGNYAPGKLRAIGSYIKNNNGSLPRGPARVYKLSEVEKYTARLMAYHRGGWLYRKKEARKELTRAKKSLNRHIQNLKDHEDQMAARGEHLYADTYNGPSIERKIESAKKLVEEVSVDLTSIEEEQASMFASTSEIVNCFRDNFAVELKYRTVLRWVNEAEKGEQSQGGRGAGRPSLLGAPAEEELVKLLKFMDSVGFPLTRKAIKDLAFEMATDEVRVDFSKKGPSRTWFHAFMRRNKESFPELVVAAARDSDTRTSWTNSGDVLKRLTTQRMAQRTGTWFQYVPEATTASTVIATSSSAAASSSGSEQTELLAQTERAESIFNTIVNLKPSLGKYRTMADKEDNHESREVIRQDALAKIGALIVKNQSSLPGNIQMFVDVLTAEEEDVQREFDEAQRKANELKSKVQSMRDSKQRKVAHMKSRKYQENANMKMVEHKLIIDAQRLSTEALAVVLEKVDALSACHRDACGMVIDSSKVVGGVVPPEFNAVAGMVPEVLQVAAQGAMNGLARMATPGGRQRDLGDFTREGNTRRTQGAVMHASGTCEGTSDRTHDELVDYEVRAKRSRETAESTANAKRAKLATFQARLAAAVADMVRHAQKPLVKICRKYLDLLKEEADASGNTALKSKLVLIGLKKRTDLIDHVTSLYLQQTASDDVANVDTATVAAAAFVAAGSAVGTGAGGDVETDVR